MALPERSGRKMAGNAGGIRGFRMPGQNPLKAPMSRSQFIRTAGIGAAGVAAGAMGLGGVARAAPGDMNRDPDNIDGNPNAPTITVYPTGNPAYDVPNIQWAVDNVVEHGTVRLMAKNKGGAFTPFEMGMQAMPPTIRISKPLTVAGVTDSGKKTTVNGGFGTFAIDTIKGDISAEPSGPVNFQTLESHGAGYFFMSYRSCAGDSTIQDVDIFDTVPKFPSAGFPWGASFGIRILTEQPVYYPPDKIRGKITITDCLFDNSNTGELASNWAVSADHIHAEISVCDSIFNNIGGRCVMLWDVGKAEIRRNHMVSTISEPDYFLAQYYLRENRPIHVSGSSWETPDLHIDISDNVIDFRPVNKYKYPMLLIAIRIWGAENPKVENNSIFMTPGSNAFSTDFISNAFELLFSSGIVCSGNTVGGHMQYGAVAYECTGSEFFGNDLSGLTTDYSQVDLYYSNSNNFDTNRFGPTGYWGVSCIGSKNEFKGNTFGPISTSYIPAIYCDGNENAFGYNDFTQTGLKGFKVSSTDISRAGCIFLEYGASGNTVSSMITDLPPLEYPWYDPWLQFADVSGNNSISLYRANPNPPPDTMEYPAPADMKQYDQLMKMLAQYSRYKELKESLNGQIVLTAKIQ